MPANCNGAARRYCVCCALLLGITRLCAGADSGFYADASFQYVSNSLNGISRDEVQGAELGINVGYTFRWNFSAGISTNLNLGSYVIAGNLNQHDGPRYYNEMVYAFPVYRFDIFPYFLLSIEPQHWIRFSLGISPEISIYQYMFNNTVNQEERREIVGTQAFSLGLIPEVRFRIFENIVFGGRIHLVPFTFTGRSVYVFYFSGEKVEGYNSFEKEGPDVQNQLFKFSIFVGYFFGKSYYKATG